MNPLDWCIPASEEFQQYDLNRAWLLHRSKFCTEAPAAITLILQINPQTKRLSP
jgi:hypothetical protein